jgi:hypothetical protein
MSAHGGKADIPRQGCDFRFWTPKRTSGLVGASGLARAGSRARMEPLPGYSINFEGGILPLPDELRAGFDLDPAGRAWTCRDYREDPSGAYHEENGCEVISRFGEKGRNAWKPSYQALARPNLSMILRPEQGGTAG